MMIDCREIFMLLETLTAAAHHHADLPGAINVPPDQLAQTCSDILPSKPHSLGA